MLRWLRLYIVSLGVASDWFVLFASVESSQARAHQSRQDLTRNVLEKPPRANIPMASPDNPHQLMVVFKTPFLIAFRSERFRENKTPRSS